MDLVMLDRDGVINIDRIKSILNVDDFQLIPQSAQAIAFLNQAQIPVVVITNQACVGRGDLDQKELKAIHKKMQTLLAQERAHIDEIYVCTDVEIEPHRRRKPAPGMIYEALKKFNARPAYAPFIGDALRDLQAARAVGCPRVLVRTGKGCETEKEILDACNLFLKPVHIFDNLYAAVIRLLKTLDATHEPFYTSASFKK